MIVPFSLFPLLFASYAAQRNEAEPRNIRRFRGITLETIAEILESVSKMEKQYDSASKNSSPFLCDSRNRQPVKTQNAYLSSYTLSKYRPGAFARASIAQLAHHWHWKVEGRHFQIADILLLGHGSTWTTLNFYAQQNLRSNLRDENAALQFKDREIYNEN